MIKKLKQVQNLEIIESRQDPTQVMQGNWEIKQLELDTEECFANFANKWMAVTKPHDSLMINLTSSYWHLGICKRGEKWLLGQKELYLESEVFAVTLFHPQIDQNLTWNCHGAAGSLYSSAE